MAGSITHRTRPGAPRGAPRSGATPRSAAAQPSRATPRPAAAQPSRAARWWHAAGCLALAAVLAACSAGRPATGRSGPGKGPPRHGAFVLGPQGFVPLGAPNAGGSGTRPQISVGRIPPASSGQSIVMPLDSYQQVISQQQAALAAVTVLLIHRCMQEAGFSYPAVPQPANGERLLQSIEQPAEGPISLAQAETYGFGQPKAQPGRNGPSGGRAPPGGQSGVIICGNFGCVPLQDMRKHSHAWIGALLGTFPGARVRARPHPGCLETSQVQLSGRRPIGTDPLPELASQAVLWTRSDPRILAVQRSWSACMAARGYTYQTVLQPEQRRWPSTPTRAEIATAVADVSCKTRVNLPNTWLAVEAAYQRALIAENLALLSQLQTNFGVLLHRAETLLGTA